MTFDVERERRALAQVEEALSWPEAEREFRLRDALSSDPTLLAEVRELLGTVMAGSSALPTRLPVPLLADEQPPPERIGPYRLGALLGAGGMGRVFRAARADGMFEKEVAIKLTRRTQLAGIVAEQFARERRILASLQHRNIAQLFDGGITATGESWFAMELVAGLEVIEYARQGLDVRGRLQLFRQIAGAVQYAHARLVVHADIKPSNVIVTADGTAKLLDFGVARALADASAADSPRPIGYTPGYSSPARLLGAAAVTTDDVYSLGVLLDELLQPCGPIAADLRSIVARASAAEVAERYASVEALQDDLQRWLTGQPVVAHRAGWTYTARKVVARNRLAAAIAAVCVLLLTGAAVALAVLFVRAEQARAETDVARRNAEQRFTDLRDLSRFVLFDVYDRLENVPRSLTLRRDLADAGQRYLDQLSQDVEAPVGVRLELIEGLRRLAQVQASPGASSLALAPQARRNLDRAQSLAESLEAEGADGRTRALVLARVLLARARLSLAVDMNASAAEAALERAQALVAPFVARSVVDVDALGVRADITALRAEALQWQGRYANSIAGIRAELERTAAVGAATWPAIGLRADALRRARLFDLLAEGLYYGGEPAVAESPYREQLRILEALSAADPADLGVARLVQRAGWALGTTLLELRRPTEAEPILARARQLAGELRRLDPEDREAARIAAVTASAHAQALVAIGRVDTAIPMLREVAEQRRAASLAGPDDFGAARDHAVALAMLADAYADTGRAAKACPEYAAARLEFERLQAAGRLAQLDRDYALRLVLERQERHCR